MKLGSSLSLASLLALSFVACSPATASITDVLPRVQVEPGETLEVDVRFCIDGPRADSPFIEASGTVVLANDDGTTVAYAVAYALDGNGDETNEFERVDVARGEEQASTLFFDDDGPWTTRDGRRCGDWQTIRVEVEDDGDAVSVEVSANMGLDVEEELGEDNLEIEWGELQVFDDAERD